MLALSKQRPKWSLFQPIRLTQFGSRVGCRRNGFKPKFVQVVRLLLSTSCSAKSKLPMRRMASPSLSRHPSSLLPFVEQSALLCPSLFPRLSSRSASRLRPTRPTGMPSEKSQSLLSLGITPLSEFRLCCVVPPFSTSSGVLFGGFHIF